MTPERKKTFLDLAARWQARAWQDPLGGMVYAADAAAVLTEVLGALDEAEAKCRRLEDGLAHMHDERWK